MGYGVLVVTAMGAAALVGCASEDEGCPGEPNTFAVDVDGRTSIYRGCEVARDIRESGTFEPDPGDAYVLIELPSKLVPSDPSNPTTVSLCDPTFEVRFEDHAGYCPGSEPPDRNNPVYSEVSPDDCVVHGVSGQTGVFGVVQIVRQTDGHLSAAHDFAADVYYQSERGTVDGWAISYVTFGVVADEDLEDPLLAEPCGCSIEEPCPRPDPPPGN
jgi:hypothetical protein